MSIKLQLPKVMDLRPRITVVGIGGAGGNAINNMISSGLTGVEFVVANTDAQALAASSCESRIQLGVHLTEGLGAGSKPEIGQAAAEEAVEDIRSRIAGSHMVFIAAGMGGGTGTGAAAVIARIAKEEGILVVSIVTKPFQFEGARRLRVAEAGIAELKPHVDTLIVIPNQNLFRVANERTTFAEAFVLADQVLYSGIACIVDLIVKEGLINLDFADVRTVLAGMGTAMMGTGEAAGDRRAIVAAEEAICNPLLDDVSLRGARGLLLSIIGGRDLTLYEVDEAASRVRQEVDPDANIIVGATFDDTLGDRVRVSIVASGMEGAHLAKAQPAAAGLRSQAPATPPAAPPPATPRPAHSAVASAGLDTTAADAEAMARALSAAFPQTVEPPRPPVPMAEADLAPAWSSPDGVVIQEGLGSLAGATTPPPLPPATAAGRESYRDDPHGFTPRPPQEVKRPVRRMPDLEDFPEIAQRDYRAKQPGTSQPQPASPSPRVYAGDQQPQAPRKKPGLFERLTGRGRRDETAPGEPPAAYPQAPSVRGQSRSGPDIAASQRRYPDGLSRSVGEEPESSEISEFLERRRR